MSIQILTNKFNLGDSDVLRNGITDFLTKGDNRGSDILRMAEEATTETEPIPSQTKSNGEGLEGLANINLGSMGNVGDIITSVVGMISKGGFGSSKSEQSTPQVRRPTSFATRTNKKK